MSTENQSNVKADVFSDFPEETKIRTKKMMMWLIIFAIVMLFGGITSAMIVLYGKMYWVHVVPPMELWVSLGIIAVSSVTTFLSLKAIKAGNKGSAIGLTVATIILGVLFSMTQIQGWQRLSQKGMGMSILKTTDGQQYSRWNPLYALKGEYGVDFTIEKNGVTLEKVGNDYFMPGEPEKPLTSEVERNFNASGALIAVLVYVHIFHLALGLIYLVVNGIRIRKGIIHAKNWISLYAGGMYWHFMGILWAYLFFFLFYLY
jgi:cytochrome c oxidase subunit III